MASESDGAPGQELGGQGDSGQGPLWRYRSLRRAGRLEPDPGQQLAAENRKPLREFTNQGLYELTTLLTEARSLLVGLNRVTTEVERDPARFLFGNQQQGYETPQ